MAFDSPSFITGVQAGLARQLNSFLEYCQPRTIRHEDTHAGAYGCPAYSPGSYGSRFKLIAFVPNEGKLPTDDLQGSDLQKAFWHSIARVASLILVVIGYVAIALAVITPPHAATMIAAGISAEQMVNIGAACFGVAMGIFGISLAILKEEAVAKYSQPVRSLNILIPLSESTTKSYEDKWFSGHSRKALKEPITRTNRNIAIYSRDQTEISRVHQGLRIGEIAFIAFALLGITLLILDAAFFPVIMLPITIIDLAYVTQVFAVIALALHLISRATLDEAVQARESDLGIRTREKTIDLYTPPTIVPDSYIKKSDLDEVALYKHFYIYSTAFTSAEFNLNDEVGALTKDKERTIHTLFSWLY